MRKEDKFATNYRIFVNTCKYNQELERKRAQTEISSVQREEPFSRLLSKSVIEDLERRRRIQVASDAARGLLIPVEQGISAVVESTLNPDKKKAKK